MKRNSRVVKYISIIIAFMFFAAGIILPTHRAEAEGEDVSVIMMVSDDTIRIKNTVTITVSIKSKKPFSTKLYLNFSDEYFDYVDGDFTLDGRLLSIELRGDSHYISGDFKAKKAGSARFYTSAGNILDENGLQLTVAHAGAWIDIVDESGTTESTADETSEDTEEEQNTSETAGTEATETEPEGDPAAEINGISYSFVTLDDEYVPAGFKEGTAKYKGWTVPAYVSPNKAVKVVALQDEEEHLYLSILEESSDSLQAYDPVTPGTARFLIKDKPKNVAVPDGYKEESYDFGKGAVKAYKNEEMPDLILVYAINLDGAEGFYYYDTAEKTFLRYYEPVKKEVPTEEPSTVTPVQNETKTRDDGFFNRENLIIIAITLSALFLIMSILAITFMVKSSKRQGTIEELEDRLYRLGKKQRSYRYEYEDDYEDQPPADDYRDQPPADDYEYDDEYDDEDYFREGEAYEEEPKPLENPVSGETIEIVMVEAEDNNKSVPVPHAVDRKVNRVEEAMKQRPHGIDSAFDVVDEGKKEETDDLSAGKPLRPARPVPRPLRPEFRDNNDRDGERRNASTDRESDKRARSRKPQKVALPFDDEEDEG